MNKIVGVIIMILSFVLANLETQYFGNNMFPNSLAESILDLCCLLLFLLGCVVFVKKNK